MSLERSGNTEPHENSEDYPDIPENTGDHVDTVGLVVTFEDGMVVYERNLLVIDTDGEKKMTRVSFAASLGAAALDPEVAAFLNTHLV